ncbi:8952_t:CDS:2 [Diversispora eburnea]|uniref:8952_t:CDS:1 n=1 Tax=Diversispora eburnea TaxID=1213867 RepID=A0A9N9FGM8_9GLOM|nr:8952_t:CDS:2 [Diversispora eburnea]
MIGKTRSSRYSNIYEFTENILSSIFKELTDPELSSCILVNKAWCNLALPLLWEDPLSWGAPIIEIYLKFLPSEQRKSISKIGINLPNVPKNFKPIYCYPKYIKKFSYTELHEATYSWLLESKNVSMVYQDLFDKSFNQVEAEHNPNGKIIIEKMTSLIYHLIKLLFLSSKGFEMIDLSTSYKSVGIPPLLSKIPDMFKMVFTDLKHLKVHTNYADSKVTTERLDSANKLFTKIVEYCNNLEYLDAKDLSNEKNEMRQLFRLVGVQKNLKFFTARNFELWPNLMIKLGEATENTLVSFNLSGVPINIHLLEHLSHCKALKYLALVRYNNELSTGSSRSSITFITAKELYFYKNRLESNTLKSILRSVGKNLKSLTVVNNNTEAIIQGICKFCPNLKYLALTIYSDTKFSTLTDWLTVSKLETLILGTLQSNIHNFSDLPQIDLGEILKDLGNHFPISLKCVDFDFEITPHQLEFFLRRSNQIFEELGLHQASGLEDKHLKIIKNHAKLTRKLIEVTFDRTNEEKPDRSYFSNKYLADAEKHINTITSTSIDPFIDPLQKLFRVYDLEVMDTEYMIKNEIENW